ncbi:MAG: PTS transporter subunit IIC [Christensenellales bacterium]
MKAESSGKLRAFFSRYFIDAMSYMALGLFSSLIIGLILSQLSAIPGLHFLKQFADLASASSPVVGAAIGVAIAYGLKVKPLVIFSSALTGAIGYSLGGPVGAYLAVVVGARMGGLCAGRTPVDIVLVPVVTIVSGGLIAQWTGPAIAAGMTALGGFINEATRLRPLPMGIAVSVIMGMVLTAPISSAAIAISLGLDGLAAGAACVGCCANMIGFAVQSYPDNGLGGLLSQGLGTSMLQFGNILKKPLIWLPPIFTSALLGPISTMVFKLPNNPVGAGMGTSGLVGQFGAFASMQDGFAPLESVLLLLLMHFILPALLTWGICWFFRRAGWIKPGDMKLPI